MGHFDTKTKTIIAGVATVVMIYIMNHTGKDLATATTPLKIVDMELADNKAAVENILKNWSLKTADGTTIIYKAKINTYWDFFFLISYGALFYFWNIWLAEKQTGGLKKWLTRAANFSVLAAIFDIVENILMLQSLDYQVSDLTARLTTIFAQMKFAMIGISIVSVLIFSVVIFVKNKKLYAL